MKAIPTKELSLFDSTCVIVGIILGAGIYEITPTVASCMNGWKGILGVWLAGGFFALTGALCYAELATAYPNEGGDYVYQTRAYGQWAGYLFGWSQLVIIRPGDIALLSFVFARYASTIYSPFPNTILLYAGLAILLLTVINILGVKEGKYTQNLLTTIKSIGLLLVIVAGLLAPANSSIPVEMSTSLNIDLKLSLILVMFTFGGWNEMAYVAAEIKSPEKNIVRALVIGTVSIIVLYVLVNLSFLSALGYENMASSQAIAVDTLATLVPDSAAKLISILICISALGAINGLIFTGARISYAIGSDHSIFRGLGAWNPELGTPVRALVLQGLLSLGFVFFAGSFIDTILYTAPVVWLFFLATGISVFVLRKRDSSASRPYRVTGFPFTVILFCASCIFMLYNSLTYAIASKPIGLIVILSVVLAGIIIYGLSKKR
ncbi:MAG: amino acid permease [Deltaproteobacteria bacterium]|nr:amino acid permease [Deltaproteobacteria bacterium]